MTIMGGFGLLPAAPTAVTTTAMRQTASKIHLKKAMSEDHNHFFILIFGTEFFKMFS